MPKCASEGWCSPWDPNADCEEDAEKQLNSLAWGAACVQSSLPATSPARRAGSLGASMLAWPGLGHFCFAGGWDNKGGSPFRRGKPHPLSPAGSDRYRSLCVREDPCSLTWTSSNKADKTAASSLKLPSRMPCGYKTNRIPSVFTTLYIAHT